VHVPGHEWLVPVRFEVRAHGSISVSVERADQLLSVRTKSEPKSLLVGIIPSPRKLDEITLDPSSKLGRFSTACIIHRSANFAVAELPQFQPAGVWTARAYPVPVAGYIWRLKAGGRQHGDSQD
jgi:hypothetical protein